MSSVPQPLRFRGYSLNSLVYLAQIGVLPCRIQLSTIQHTVEKYYGLPLDSLTGKSRAEPLAKCRHIFCYIAYTNGHGSFKQIGKHLAGRDHSTIVHSVQLIRRWVTGRAIDYDLVRQICEIQSTLEKRPKHLDVN